MPQIVATNDHSIIPEHYHKLLLNWGAQNIRQFPWRETRNPYYILISEVMLHRTQARQVVPVYKNFIKRYPDIPTLSRTEKEELHKILFSLGLRWRIDLILEMANELMYKFGGEVPEKRDALLSLTGVSEYIAGAVRCFAWDHPEPLADTNTVRVIGRLFALNTKDSSRRNRVFMDLLAQLVSQDQPRDYSYALLDLADRICLKRKEPDCGNCPLQSMCRHGIELTDE
jgi:A/G-specific adenine glycosylase